MRLHKPIAWTAATASLLALGLAASAQAQAHAHHPAPPAPPAGLAPLDDRVKAGIEEALLDEWQGEATYARVLKDHGDVRPFSNVVRAEGKHAALLGELLKARGLAVPENRWKTAEVPASASAKEACAAALEFEARNVALYDRLIGAGPLPDDVKRVFDHNRMASLDHHKAAFERCSGVGSGGAGGRGGGCGCSGHGHGSGQGCQRCGHAGGRGPHGCGHGQGGKSSD